jgi:hypothetical protein
MSSFLSMFIFFFVTTFFLSLSGVGNGYEKEKTTIKERIFNSFLLSIITALLLAFFNH